MGPRCSGRVTQRGTRLWRRSPSLFPSLSFCLSLPPLRLSLSPSLLPPLFPSPSLSLCLSPFLSFSFSLRRGCGEANLHRIAPNRNSQPLTLTSSNLRPYTHWTLNPQPEPLTPTPKPHHPQILNPKPQIPNPKPQTPNPKPQPPTPHPNSETSNLKPGRRPRAAIADRHAPLAHPERCGVPGAQGHC